MRTKIAPLGLFFLQICSYSAFCAAFKLEHGNGRTSLVRADHHRDNNIARHKLLPLESRRRPATSSSSCDALAIRGGAALSKVQVDSFLNAVDLFGTGVFAFSGALTAGRKGMDMLGMIIIATITSIGGGTARDLLLGSGTAFWIRRPIYFEICLVVTVATYFFWPTLEKKMGWKDSAGPICTADAAGLSAFAVLGTQKAADHSHNLAPILWVLFGVVTSTFGGITRDVLCQQAPRVMYPTRSMYATAPLVGSILYTILTNRFNVPQERAACASFVATFCTRVLSWRNPWRLPHWKEEAKQ